MIPAWLMIRHVEACRAWAKDKANGDAEVYGRLYRAGIHECVNCKMLVFEHADGKCLFEPTYVRVAD